MILGYVVRVLTLASAATAFAAPPAVGEKAPDFALTSLQGTTMRLSEVISKKPVVLVVLRGYPGYQCPLCNRQAQDFMQNGASLTTSARVIMVYPGPAADLKEKAEEFMSNKKFPDGFDLVLDQDYEFTTSYGLRWNAPKETAYPSTFIIDHRGVVVFSKISDSHGGRTKASEILEVLQKTKNVPQ